jgi:hypothetical protein
MIHRSYYAGEMKRVGANALFAKQTAVRASRRALEAESDSLRQRTARLCGKINATYGQAWMLSNVGIGRTAWGLFMCGQTRLPAKYHGALGAFLDERGV